MILKTLLIFNLILVLPLSASSETSVFRWVDDDGHVHYGGKPKKDNAEEITIKDRYIETGNVKPLTPDERVEKQKRYIEAEDAENRSIKNQKLKKEKKAEDKIRRCNAARDQLKRAEQSGGLYDLDKKGNRVLLNTKQYKLAIKQARARVTKWCN